MGEARIPSAYEANQLASLKMRRYIWLAKCMPEMDTYSGIRWSLGFLFPNILDKSLSSTKVLGKRIAKLFSLTQVNWLCFLEFRATLGVCRAFQGVENFFGCLDETPSIRDPGQARRVQRGLTEET